MILNKLTAPGFLGDLASTLILLAVILPLVVAWQMEARATRW